jgi:hypothetical protein
MSGEASRGSGRSHPQTETARSLCCLERRENNSYDPVVQMVHIRAYMLGARRGKGDSGMARAARGGKGMQNR